jgi:predicted nucleic acid-binding protein
VSIAPAPLDAPVLADTGTWTWVKDRRHPELAAWFNREAAEGRILVCDIVILELVRLAPNADRARAMARTLSAFEAVPPAAEIWSHARELQLALAEAGDHRRVPPSDLLIAAAAMQADVPVLHYDRDYERIAAVSSLRHMWLVPPGALA